MFPEFHGYIIDPKKRSLDLNVVTSSITTWHYFGNWEAINGELRCRAGWMLLSHNNCLYLLAQQQGLIIMQNDVRNDITWDGPPPLPPSACTLL